MNDNMAGARWQSGATEATFAVTSKARPKPAEEGTLAARLLKRRKEDEEA